MLVENEIEVEKLKQVLKAYKDTVSQYLLAENENMMESEYLLIKDITSGTEVFIGILDVCTHITKDKN